MITSPLRFEDITKRFQVVLSKQAVEHMIHLCSANCSQETGGILIGSYSDDCTTAEILEATDPPKDSKFGRDWFHRGTDELKELLAVRWNCVPRTFYLGEWHSHTANVPWPSLQDKKQIRKVARTQRYNCVQPLLIIVYPRLKGNWDVSCHVFVDKNLLTELHKV